MGKTEKALLEVMKNGDTICPDKEQLDAYVNALNEFNALIEQGYIKSRGYNLQTVDERGFTMAFNVGVLWFYKRWESSSLFFVMEQRFGTNRIDKEMLREFCEWDGEVVTYREGVNDNVKEYQK